MTFAAATSGAEKVGEMQVVSMLAERAYCRSFGGDSVKYPEARSWLRSPVQLAVRDTDRAASISLFSKGFSHKSAI